MKLVRLQSEEDRIIYQGTIVYDEKGHRADTRIVISTQSRDKIYLRQAEIFLPAVAEHPFVAFPIEYSRLDNDCIGMLEANLCIFELPFEKKETGILVPTGINKIVEWTYKAMRKAIDMEFERN